ncbi:MAG: ABC transporter ATP-binding protein [Synergistaceae bacterium]|jgi:ABC-type polysaccharide/polyol phosphate transport system ATPase subunit|nr:ABC transporter ATP-binding protein [Synergistaceae bacterium]
MSSIRLTNVFLDFPIDVHRGSVRRHLIDKLKIKKHDFSQENYFRALDGINLQIREGERLGLIGLNGAGKTTLLKVIAGIYFPTGGEISVEGRVDSFLNPSAGIRSDATGYENIVNQLLYKGCSVKTIKALLPEIIEFSELEDFIHVPIQKYSAGMLARLNFSVTTSVEPDILILDEWLSAGDFEFLRKAQERMRRIASQSKILVLASHDMNLIRSVCSTAAVLRDGRIVSGSSPDEAVDFYMEGQAG